jgi:hypothetical protein
LALELPDFQVNQELISNLFHPNQLLREVAALVIHKKDAELFDSVLERLEPHVQFEMRETLSIMENEEKFLMIEKYNLLKNIGELSDMPESVIIEFAHAFEEKRHDAGTSFPLKQHKDEYALFLMVEGEMMMEGEEGGSVLAETYQLYYSNIFINAGVESINFTQDTVLLAIKDEIIEELLFDHMEIANCVLSCVEQFKRAS